MMNVSAIIGQAFNNAVEIDKTWFILTIPFFIYYIISFIFGVGTIAQVLEFILSLIELGVLYKIISHLLEGNEKLPKPDFNIYDADLFVGAIKSFVRLLIFIIIAALIITFIISIGVIIKDSITVFIVALLAAILLSVLVSLSGLVLAHGININSFTEGILKLPNMISSIGIVNLIMFIFINIVILIAGGVIVGILSFIPVLGSIVGNAMVSAVFSFYFVLASTYMYKQYVYENRGDFNQNTYNKLLGYPIANNDL